MEFHKKKNPRGKQRVISMKECNFLCQVPNANTRVVERGVTFNEASFFNDEATFVSPKATEAPHNLLANTQSAASWGVSDPNRMKGSRFSNIGRRFCGIEVEFHKK